MNYLLKSTSAIVFILAVAILSSCSGNKKSNQEDTTVLSDIKKEQVKEDVSEFVYPLPSPFELTDMLNRIGASYILSLSNPAENAEKYFTEIGRAVNLGIYGADLSYASTYNQKQIAMDYMNASNKLIEELGITDAIDQSVYEKIEKIENDKDQIIDLITNTFYSTYEYLNKNNRGALSVMVLSGTWVEGLYIATHISEDTYNNVEMVKIVMDQKEPLNRLYELMDKFTDDADIKKIHDGLGTIHQIYQSVEEGSITQKQMEEITTSIADVRAQMIK